MNSSALACPAELPPLDGPNFFEYFLGATNSNAFLGDGELTATLSRCGELTTLKWPGPGALDQLAYLTTGNRQDPHLGALPNMGAFAGIAYSTRDGANGFTWLRDAPWSHRQSYASDTSPVVITAMENQPLGLSVTAASFVMPGQSVLVTNYRVERASDSPVAGAKLIAYTNFSPTLRRIPLYPVSDWLLDFRNDFAVVYDERLSAMLHFLPQSAVSAASDLHDFSSLDPLMKEPRPYGDLRRSVRALVRGLNEPGVYIEAGFRRRSDGFQAGYDEAPICAHQSPGASRALELLAPAPPLGDEVRDRFICDRAVLNSGGVLGACRDQYGWARRAEDAYVDAQDGELSGSFIAACQANAALSISLHFRPSDNVATTTFFISVAGTKDEVFRQLRHVRRRRPAALQANAERWWKQELSSAVLPATDDPSITAFAHRSLMVMRASVDDESGAVVASVAAQPPYGYDWPRDGAFINYALDLAGYESLVTRHNLFYARVQRQEPASWSPFYPFPPCDPLDPIYPTCIPAGTFENNYYPDADEAVPGYPIPFEIDHAGLGVWTMWEHARFLADPTARASYLASVCPAIRLGAENLAACRDPSNGLQCHANEDDNFWLTQGLQGAGAVLLALDSAVAAAADCGFDVADRDAWAARAVELGTASVASFYTPGPPARFDSGRGGERSGWLIWPVGILPPADPRVVAHADWLFASRLDPVLDRTAVWSSYEPEIALVEAQLARQLGDPIRLQRVQDAIRFLVRELTTEGTMLLGESYGRVSADRNGDGVAPDYLPLNSVPHTWSHAYLYAAAVVAFGARTEARVLDAPSTPLKNSRTSSWLPSHPGSALPKLDDMFDIACASAP